MKSFLAITGALAFTLGCSSSSSDASGTDGGPSGAGGGAANGGATANGGGTANGGATANGGSTANGGGTANGGSGANGGTTSGGGSSGNGGAASGGASGSAGASGSGGSGGTAANGGAGGGTSLPTTWDAGNPDGSCGTGVPAEGQLVDTSSPTTVVGTGTAASCTYDALNTAVAAGGIITFDCGSDPVAIPITASLEVRTDVDTVIDGGELVTLDGQSSVRILHYHSANFQALDTRLTLQRLRLVNGKTTPTEAIPTAPEPCSQGWNDGEGGALYMRDGNLTVIDCIFENNQAAPLGPDTGGGAIYVVGSKYGTVIVGSTFTGNQASNAGAVGGLFCEHHIYDSLFSGNTATGHDANNNDPGQCDYINNGQNEIGSGGNGGAIYSDGNDVNIILCGDKIVDNHAGDNAFGGGLFFTSNNYGGTLSIADTTMTGNTGGSWTNTQSGSITNAGTAVGTNCQSITIDNSTIQGYP
jgi:hypothetical protein